ncbi:MAG: spore germination protein [Candidatus Aminicenantes bacterium]|nr:spore germination protein [Candidatus Aminicenantes bacterium]
MKKRKISPSQWTLLGLSLIVVIVLAAVLFRGAGGEKIKTGVAPLPAESPPEPASPRPTKTIALFFLSEEDSLLHPETREILAGPSIGEEAKQAVQELIRGSGKGYISPLPPETKLRQLFVTKEGVAYVDLSREVMEKHPSGSSAELATVYSIVNTLAYNFKPIKKVFLLVEGSEKETLGGHLNLSEPFVPLLSLNAR